jgi:hypothetical protein
LGSSAAWSCAATGADCAFALMKMGSFGSRCGLFPVCGDQAERCDRCGGRVLAPLVGTAYVRGGHWAEDVVRLLVSRWPIRWPRSPKALIIAGRKVDDLAPGDVSLRTHLARLCLEAAARRYAELTEFLMQRRLRLPGSEPPPVGDDDDFPA